MKASRIHVNGLRIPITAILMLGLCAAMFAGFPGLAGAAPVPAKMSDYCIIPPFVGKSVPPLVMLNLSRDHKLYYEAYSDVLDLNDDGVIDHGYDHSIAYYGYFDPDKCYSSSGAATTDLFTKTRAATDKFCGAAGEWSGNVLNYLTMSRMDVLRKVLYGGDRETESNALTVLAGAVLPQDAHSWGKEMTGRLCFNAGREFPYTKQCGTAADCDPGDTCVDKSLELLGIAAPSAPTPCNSVAATWGVGKGIGTMLVARYRHSNKSCGLDPADLLGSYEPENLQDFFYLQSFNPVGNPNGTKEEELFPWMTSVMGDFLNVYMVTEFEVDPAETGGTKVWEFMLDSDDGAELEIGGDVVASYYGCHGPCWNGKGNTADPNKKAECTVNQHAKIPFPPFLSKTWVRLIIRHSEKDGWDGIRLWYKKPGDASWSLFGNSGLNLRAPDILPGNECSLRDIKFIDTGEPQVLNGTVTGSLEHHLFCVTSLGANERPVLRRLTNRTERVWEWASKERPVCDNSLGVPTDFRIRVEVCDPVGGVEERCKLYPGGGGVARPIGLLQKYADNTATVCSKSFKPCGNNNDCDTASGEICVTDSKIQFGLTTGSFTNNLEGGVLRKNIGDIQDEIVQTQGKFQTAESDRGNMIIPLSNMATVGFNYTTHEYDCGWITTEKLSNGKCNMWGNPIGEILYESTRHFANKLTPTPEYKYGTPKDMGLDLKELDGSASAQIVDPYKTFPACSRPFNLIISDIFPSYDSNMLPGSPFGSFAGDLSDLNVSTLANTISAEEGIGGNYFIGEVNGNYDFSCTAKNVGSLSDIRGLCAEEPTKQGSYYAAAVAYYGKEKMKICSNDFSKHCESDAECGGGGSCSKDRNLTTFSVAMSSPVPPIHVETATGTITMVPVGKSLSGTHGVFDFCAQKCTLSLDVKYGMQFTNCASDAYCPSNGIVDYYVDILEPDYGRFRINFEDVEQGADHDMDAIVQYEYCVGARCNSAAVGANDVRVTLTSEYAAGSIDQVMGMVVSGSSEDGTYMPIRDLDASVSDADTPAIVAGLPTTWSKVFTPSGRPSARLLNDPLWYAAKWGGFDDKNGNEVPDIQEEWDKDNDGVPDTYFFVANPLKLERQLDQAFSDILKRVASGTAVSVLASGEGQGANMLQAVFYPKKDFGTNVMNINELSWTGVMQNLWYYIDPVLGNSNIREDTASRGFLDLDTDYITNLFFDDTEGQTVASRCADTDGDGDCDVPQSTIPFEELNNLWEAGSLLYERTNDRTIWTNLDDDSTKDLLSDAGAAELDVVDAASATMVKDYVKGDDTGIGVCSVTRRQFCASDANCPAGETCEPARTRTAILDEAKGAATWKLGDIVHSTPRIQSWVPLNDYYDRYSDTSYLEFTKSPTYVDRGMVYVGANDGMLHAFELGKLDIINNRADKTLKAELKDPATPGRLKGEEAWAFVPKGVLPYLKYLADPDYCHLYYVDASPYLFDASIGGIATAAKDASTWRTVLIGHMRFGGACRNAGAGCGAGSASPSCVETPAASFGYSSYFALDITNQEVPEFMWEFNRAGDDDLGLASTGPVLIRISPKDTGKPDNDKNGYWYVVIPSGPTGPINSKREFEGRSDQNLKLFVLNLRTGAVERIFDTGIANAFGGSSLNSNSDLDLDYQDDMAYFTFTKAGADPNWDEGGILRLVTKGDEKPANWILGKFMDTLGSPVGGAMTASTSLLRNQRKGELWVYFGSGRYYYKTDTADGQFRIYGVKEPCYNTDFANYPNNIDPACVSSSPNGIGDVSEGALKDATTDPLSPEDMRLQGKPGWYINLDCSDATGATCGGDLVGGVLNSERSITNPSPVPGGAVFFTTFSPTSDPCSYGGSTYLWGVDYASGGLAKAGSVIGKALLQLSTGEIKEIDLAQALTEKTPENIGPGGGNTPPPGSPPGRRTASFHGVPPEGEGLSVMIPPDPLQRVFFIQER